MRDGEQQRSSVQTLLVGMAYEGALDLLSGRVAGNPGRRSLKLACPGLLYAALSGLMKTVTGKTAKLRSCVLAECHSC